MNEHVGNYTFNNLVLPGKGCEYIVTKTKLGEGSFSKVYKGYIQRRELVAIKKILLDRIKKYESNLEEEIRIMKSLQHKNIVNLVDTIHHDGQIYLVIEHCADGDLKKYLHRRPMREKHARYYLKQLMEGLRYLKSRNIIHRDLKPQNLLLTDNKKTLKISDFGFAKKLSSEESMAETMCGTPYYMAPEIMHNKKYQSKADLWSVGIIMYEMLYGKYPYGKDITGPYDLRDKIDSIVIDYPSMSEALSDDALDLLKNLLQKDPGNRISWEEYFIHPWFHPNLRMRAQTNTQNIPITAMSAPTKTNNPLMFEMEDSASNLNTLSYANSPQNAGYYNNTFSSASPFGNSNSPHPITGSTTNNGTSFLNLVDDYRSVGGNESSRMRHPLANQSEPVLVKRHPQYDEDESDEEKDSTWTQQVKGYWNTSIRLAKDSFRSFHSLP